jgi:site-specific DNA-methyltransferase (adenine-specific)
MEITMDTNEEQYSIPIKGKRWQEMQERQERQVIAEKLINPDMTMEKRRDSAEIPISSLAHSRFNSRKSRKPEDVGVLAERIQRIGFEQTRALWAVPFGDTYEVFAGGTRFEAAKQAGLETVPVLVHSGYSDEEIARFADVDNENDEYHVPVSIIDIWAEYARLRDEEGWTQEKIAKVKGVDKSLVSRRVRLNNLPNKLKGYVDSGILSETHLRSISDGVDLSQHFSPWLTPERAMLELAEKAAYDRKKNGDKSVRALETDIAAWKEWITHAEKVYASLDSIVMFYDLSHDPPEPYEFHPQEGFIQELDRRKARSLSAVRDAELAIRRIVADGLEQYKNYLEEKSSEAVLERARAEKVAALVAGFKLGDARELTKDVVDSSVRLLLTDPPYGMDYQSNRRWITDAPDKIANDGQEEAMALIEDVLTKAIPKLEDDAHVLVFCSWRGEPLVRDILEKVGLTVKGSLIWVKEEHSAGDVKGSFAPQHECIVHGVKGSPEVVPRRADVFQIPRAKRDLHPMEKPVDLLKQLIESTTSEGDLVLDPFAGIASTCVAAIELNRAYIGFELDQDYFEKGRERLLRTAESVAS